MPTKNQKADVRKKRNRLRRQIDHIKLQQARNGFSETAVSSFNGEQSSHSIPLELKRLVVNAHAMLCRTSEALGFQIRHDLETYCETHELRERAFNYAADDIGKREGGSTRQALGVSVQLREAAVRCRKLAARGRLHLQYVPQLPSSSSDVIASASWINDEILEAARMQAERQVKRAHERANLEEYYRILETI